MKVPSLQLEAFYEVAKTGHFTKAATGLHITQSALSQRILNLESGLGASLFFRDRKGLRLTPAGEKLLRYCQAQNRQEEELLQELKGGKGPGGWLRIGATSSLLWSVVVPALGDFVRDNPDVRVDFRAGELRELGGWLKTGEADLILTSEKPEETSWQVNDLGREEYVLVSSSRKKFRKDVYLDHDPEDSFTLNFLKRNGLIGKKPRREYLDDIHGLLAGVAEGWGQAVIPRHLAEVRADLKVQGELKTHRTPVLLVSHDQSHPGRLLSEVTRVLKQEVPRRLAGRG